MTQSPGSLPPDPTGVRVTPRIEVENIFGVRLEPEALPIVIPAREGSSTVAMAMSGLAVLITGLTVLEVGNFVADQFARAGWLGWLTLAVALSGFGLIAAGVWRELSFMARLDNVEQLRQDLADPQRAQQAARSWLTTIPGGETLLPAIGNVTDPHAIAALLRAGPAGNLREQAGALGGAAAMQVFAVTAAVPSPALDGAVVALRGIRLVRQVAALYGLRPSTLGTIALLRRTLLSGVYVGGANLAADTAMKAFLSNATWQRLAGDAAGAAVAARRMIVLARATAAACSPVSPEQ